MRTTTRCAKSNMDPSHISVGGAFFVYLHCASTWPVLCVTTNPYPQLISSQRMGLVLMIVQLCGDGLSWPYACATSTGAHCEARINCAILSSSYYLLKPNWILKLQTPPKAPQRLFDSAGLVVWYCDTWAALERGICKLVFFFLGVWQGGQSYPPRTSVATDFQTYLAATHLADASY